MVNEGGVAPEYQRIGFMYLMCAVSSSVTGHLSKIFPTTSHTSLLRLTKLHFREMPAHNHLDINVGFN